MFLATALAVEVSRMKFCQKVHEKIVGNKLAAKSRKIRTLLMLISNTSISSLINNDIYIIELKRVLSIVQLHMHFKNAHFSLVFLCPGFTLLA